MTEFPLFNNNKIQLPNTYRNLIVPISLVKLTIWKHGLL